MNSKKRKYDWKLWLAAIFALWHNGLMAQPPSPALCWKPEIWGDEFSSPPLDIQKWCRNDWHQFFYNDNPFKAFRTSPSFAPDNVIFLFEGTDTFVRQFVLAEARTRLAFDIQSPSGVMDTATYELSAPCWFQSKAKFKYGYFEARLRLPELLPGETNKGVGANFWLYKDNLGAVPKSEIDVVEFIASPSPQTHTCNVHYYGIALDTVHDLGSSRPMPNDGQFHTFGAWWGPDFIKFYIDGQFYRDARRQAELIADDLTPMTIILDINVFTNGEIIKPNTRLPYHFDIDYVRVFQLDTEQCQNDYAQSSPMAALNSVYRNITFGGGSAMPANASKSLTARNAISIKPDFEAPLGSELTLSIYPYCHQNIAVTSCPACNCD